MTYRRSHHAVELGLVALLLVISRAAAAGPKAETFATPESVIEHFVKSVATDDFDGALDAFGVDDRVAHFDFSRQVRRMGVFSASRAEAPTRYKLYMRTNTLEATKLAANEILHWAHGLLTDDRSPAGPRAAIQAIDLTQLRDLKVVRIDTPNKSVTSKPEVIELSRKEAAARGADVLTERIALLLLGHRHYWCGFRLVKFGNLWHIETLQSYFASGTSSVLLGVEKTTPEEFEAHTK